MLEAHKSKAAASSAESTGELLWGIYLSLDERLTSLIVMYLSIASVGADASLATPKSFVKSSTAAVAAFEVATTGPKKSWGVGSRHREQLAAQKQHQHQAGAAALSGQSTAGQ